MRLIPGHDYPDKCPACGKRVHVHRSLVTLWACEDPECACSRKELIEDLLMLADRFIYGNSFELDGQRVHPFHVALHQDGTYKLSRIEYRPRAVGKNTAAIPFGRFDHLAQPYARDSRLDLIGSGSANPPDRPPDMPGLDPTQIRTPEGHINNCSLAYGEEEADCQICGGTCPDRAQFRASTWPPK